MIITGGTWAWLRRKQRQNWKKQREKWASVGKDVVVLHCFPRGKTCLSLTPFPLKVETYLRMNNIKYVTEFRQARIFLGERWKKPTLVIYSDAALVPFLQTGDFVVGNRRQFYQRTCVLYDSRVIFVFELSISV